MAEIEGTHAESESNQKLSDVIDAEVGTDDGEFLPENKEGWAVTRFDP